MMKKPSILVGILSLLFLCSCSEFVIKRSYQDEMERDSDGVFVADKDFPTVSGDSGQAYRSPEEIKLRTPPTPSTKKKLDYLSSLDDELTTLEEGLPENEFQHYSRYKDKLENISEKIYFLRLKNVRARDEYLYGKGIYAEKGSSPQEEEAIRNRDILLGMSKEAVSRSWGRPVRVDVAGDPSFENERWAFYRAGRVQYIYFESGRVQGWTQ